MSKESVIAVALHVMGEVKRNAFGGSTVENALYYLEKLRNVLISSGIDVRKVEELVRDSSITRYVGLATEGALGNLNQACGQPGIIIDFTGNGIMVGPATMLDVVKDGVKAKRDHKDIINELDKYIGQLGSLSMDYQQLMETLLTIMRLTLLYVPYSGCSGYSAYAVAHAAMAYASTEATNGRFRLMGIDIVGIQEVISRIQRTKQALRQLKGRSLLINLIQHAVALRMINDINKALGNDLLSPVNILVNTGGEVVMLIPSIDGEVLGKVINNIVDDVINGFEGNLSLSIAYTESYELSKNFKEVLDELNNRIARVRYSRFRKFKANSVGLCDVCGIASGNLTKVPTADGEIAMCPFCHLAHKLGTISRRLGFIAILRDVNYGKKECEEHDVLGIRYLICPDSVTPNYGAEYIHYNLNELRIGNVSNVAYSVLFMNTRMPTDAVSGEISSLDDIKMGGMALTIKADANAMGTIKAKSSKNAAKYVLFTSLLVTIFDAYGAYLWNSNQSKYSGVNKVFLIYSGGDDIVVIGDYMTLDYLAKIIKRANEFSINVAAGALIHDAYQPVYLTWLSTEDRLEKAKDTDRSKSLIYLMNTGEAPIILEPDDALSIVNYVSRKHEYATAIEETPSESASMLYKLNKYLIEMYNSLYEVVLNTGNLLNAKRRFLRALINYTYYFNRNSDKVSSIINDLNRELLPQNLVNLLNSIENNDKDYMLWYLKILGRAIVSINISALALKAGIRE